MIESVVYNEKKAREPADFLEKQSDEFVLSQTRHITTTHDVTEKYTSEVWNFLTTKHYSTAERTRKEASHRENP
jgi:hypothetical protein